jgi:hypothetical protein
VTTTERRVTLDELKALVGTEERRFVSPPVTASDIRRFAIAIYWPETPPRLFWDEDDARATRWGGIVAPHEFNPFAWPISGPGRLPTAPPLVHGARNYNAGSEVEYFTRIRPGDVITATDRIVAVTERSGRSGRLIFITSETRWENQRGELVKIHRGHRVQVLPAAGDREGGA